MTFLLQNIQFLYTSFYTQVPPPRRPQSSTLKTDRIICKTQNKDKRWVPCLKLTKNFKIVTAEHWTKCEPLLSAGTCKTTAATRPQGQPAPAASASTLARAPDTQQTHAGQLSSALYVPSGPAPAPRHWAIRDGKGDTDFFSWDSIACKGLWYVRSPLTQLANRKTGKVTYPRSYQMLFLVWVCYIENLKDMGKKKIFITNLLILFLNTTN